MSADFNKLVSLRNLDSVRYTVFGEINMGVETLIIHEIGHVFRLAVLDRH